MAKRRLNGALKWVIVAVSLAGIAFVVADRFLYLGSVDAAIKTNVAKDEKEHAELDTVSRQAQMAIVGIQRDIGQTQKDVAQIAKGQETIDKKLDDIILLQLMGPGSGGPPTR